MDIGKWMEQGKQANPLLPHLYTRLLTVSRHILVKFSDGRLCLCWPSMTPEFLDPLPYSFELLDLMQETDGVRLVYHTERQPPALPGHDWEDASGYPSLHLRTQSEADACLPALRMFLRELIQRAESLNGGHYRD